ncbi:hypothetical protein [Actinocatenispora rupis]|uniref:Uncharacterized protein n=1 Tax=Actinocatenispora rupis TaxID=519421 RepID=A0A8J3J8X6_9ACTN|nr:hypothetical protein [Actinocatenispora rupis]GID14072.1 hypothetical protein Aru02nite_49610 [Actinocatenispora rupis]
MSLALFGLGLLITAVALAYKNWRAALAVVVGLLLGVVIAGSDGGLAHAAHSVVDGLRSTLNGIANYFFGG